MGALRSVLLAMLLVGSSLSFAQTAPRLPCAVSPLPPYAEIGQQPNFQVWRNPVEGWWTPPSCTGWRAAGGNLVVALAGAFAHSGSADDLLNRFGAVSDMPGIRYWSVTDKEWRILVTEAVAVTGADARDRRADFVATEMKTGRNLYFAQRDSRSTGEVVYRMRVREAASDRLVVEVENVTPVRTFVFTVFSPGAVKSLYFLERRSRESWGLYALVWADSPYTAGNEGSFLNRVTAYYRHFTGAPTDGAPPLAR